MTELLARDINYLKSSPSELETYLLSKDIIRQLPDLTFSSGGVLLAYKRLAAANLDKQVQSEWQEIESICHHWKTAWANKCLLEMKMRLRLWGDFLLSMAPDKNEPSTAYRHQVRNRVILQLLGESIPVQAAEFVESLERKDKILIKFSIENDFIWEKEVQPGFPKEEFWFLYRVMQYEKVSK
jgi:hypothetical protein